MLLFFFSGERQAADFEAVLADKDPISWDCLQPSCTCLKDSWPCCWPRGQLGSASLCTAKGTSLRKSWSLLNWFAASHIPQAPSAMLLSAAATTSPSFLSFGRSYFSFVQWYSSHFWPEETKQTPEYSHQASHSLQCVLAQHVLNSLRLPRSQVPPVSAELQNEPLTHSLTHSSVQRPGRAETSDNNNKHQSPLNQRITESSRLGRISKVILSKHQPSPITLISTNLCSGAACARPWTPSTFFISKLTSPGITGGSFLSPCSDDGHQQEMAVGDQVSYALWHSKAWDTFATHISFELCTSRTLN